MQKKLIALAVAGVFAAPAFAATSNVDVYGVIRIAIEDTDVSGKDMAVIDRVSRIGFKGSEDLGGGLSAIWQIETQLSATGADGVGGTQSWANRNTFVGLKSASLGTVLAGRHDTPYKLGTGSLDIFADTAGDYNLGGINLTGVGGTTGALGYVNADHDLRSPVAIAYISPTWSGVHFAVAGVATNATGNANSSDTIDAVSATAIYSQGPIFASLSYQKAENGAAALGFGNALIGNANNAYFLFGTPGGSDTAVKITDSAAWKLGLGYTFGNTTIGGIYERVNVGCIATTNSTGGIVFGAGVGCSDMELKNWSLYASHKMGNITLKAAYADSEFEGLDAQKWTLGVDYALSKRTTVYAIWNDSEADTLSAVSSTAFASIGNNDVRTIGIGLNHSF